MAETQPPEGRDVSRETVRQHRDMVGPSLEAPSRAVEEESSRSTVHRNTPFLRREEGEQRCSYCLSNPGGCDETRCPCCGAVQPAHSAIAYCDDCNTDTCGHWTDR